MVDSPWAIADFITAIQETCVIVARTPFAYQFTLSSVLCVAPWLVGVAGAIAQELAPAATPVAVQGSTLLAFEPLIDAPKDSRGGGRRLFEPPPGQDGPETARGGGRRNDNVCAQDRRLPAANLKEVAPPKQVTELITPIVPSRKWGLTGAARPTFLVYVPKTSAQSMEFTLEETATRTTPAVETYRMTVPLPQTPGVMQVQLPLDAPVLEVGKDYTWRISFACKAIGAGPEDPFVEGYVRRVAANQNGAIASAPDAALARIKELAQAGLWYDVSAELAQLNQRVKSPAIQGAWQDLLSDVNLDKLAPMPIAATRPTY